MPHRPAWFRDDAVYVSYAPTVGINKDGEDLFVINAETGTRTDVIDNLVRRDIDALLAGEKSTATSTWAKGASISDQFVGVPVYFDQRPLGHLEELLLEPDMKGFGSRTLKELIDAGWVEFRTGHGSPSSDLREGTVPYIKVSDLRAGQVNINPTNRVSDPIARHFWKGTDSGLKEYDLLTPIRTSKNIGDFAVLMPGQENVVLTKEILVLRASASAPFDTFYLLWALSLRAVRRQWDRIVFMQTNREDVGTRYNEIRLPIAPDAKTATSVSAPMRDYYQGVTLLRENYLEYLRRDDRHHIFMSTASDAITDIEDQLAGEE